MKIVKYRKKLHAEQTAYLGSYYTWRCNENCVYDLQTVDSKL